MYQQSIIELKVGDVVIVVDKDNKYYGIKGFVTHSENDLVCVMLDGTRENETDRGFIRYQLEKLYTEKK